MFIKCLNKYGQQNEEIKCIPNNEEKYISFNKKIKVDEYFNKKTKQMDAIYYKIRFLDTLGFMNTSIGKLVKNLSDGCNSVEELREVFKYTSEYFTNDEQFTAMTKTGIYPYDNIDNYNKTNDT